MSTYLPKVFLQERRISGWGMKREAKCIDERSNIRVLSLNVSSLGAGSCASVLEAYSSVSNKRVESNNSPSKGIFEKT